MCGLALDNVTMAFGPHLLFENVGAKAGPGEALVVTGANGTGKSTLLKIIAGLTRPESGAVERETVFGYAAPDVNLYAELTGRENLTFFAGLRGLSGDADGLLTQVGLPRRRGVDLVGTYSSGMRQRLKLAVSLLGDPPLLIWDEPTLALDEAGGKSVEEILDRHRRGGGVTVLATNDSAEADRWGRHGVRLHLGRGPGELAARRRVDLP